MYGYTAPYTAIRHNVRHIVLYDLHTAYEPYMYLAIYGFGGPYTPAPGDGTRHVQEVVDAMREVIPSLPFTLDCFNVTDLNTDVVELVLRDVPLAASELDVCVAVCAWAQEFFGVDSDDDSGGDDDGASSEQLLLLPRDDQRILQYIDLRCINAGELREVRFHPDARHC